jgi:hypothetical protein
MAVRWRERFLAANFTPQCAAGVSIPGTGCTSITPWNFSPLVYTGKAFTKVMFQSEKRLGAT